MSQRILQLFRSTNTWLTKNQAKAMVEINAKNLHTANAIASVKDGEPIVARYYDGINGATYSYNTTALASNPYEGQYSASHIWKTGYDSFATMPTTCTYDSAAFIRVGSGNVWSYYKMDVNAAGFTPSIEDAVSVIYGVAYERTVNNVTRLYIEWFDSNDAAQAALDHLTYNDVDIDGTNSFVTAVQQYDGLVSAIHGRLESGSDAISVTDDPYTYKLISYDPTTYGWVWQNTSADTGTVVPTTPTANSSKYFRKSDGNTPASYTYYELTKVLKVSLIIEDPTSNVLAQGGVSNWVLLSSEPSTTWDATNTFTTIPAATSSSPQYIRVGTTGDYRYYILNSTANDSGLSANITMRALSPSEISALGTNVKSAYKLVGNANGTDTQLGETIMIYKDQSLYSVYLGHVDDTLTSETNPTVISGTGNDALCFIYEVNDGTYELVAIDIESFLTETEFKDGLEIIRGTYEYKQISEEPSGVTWDATNSGASLPATVTESSPEYYRVGTAEPYTYYQKSSNGTVQVKLSSTGGLEFKNEGVGVNKSIGIKICSDNEYPYPVDSNGNLLRYSFYQWEAASGVYDTQYIYTTTDHYQASGVDLDTYTHDPNDWDWYWEAVDNAALTGGTGTYTTGGYVLDSNGSRYNPTGEIFVGYVQLETPTGDYRVGSVLTLSECGLDVNLTVIDQIIADNFQSGMTVNGKYFLYNPTTGAYELNLTGNDINIAESAGTVPTVTESDHVPTSGDNPGFYIYNGIVYEWDGTTATPWDVTSDTTLSEAISVLNKMAYDLDMGTYTISQN